MAERSYWSSVIKTRIDRRRALAATISVSAGAALLAACGGGDSDKGGGQEVSRLITPITDSSKQAKKGGVYKDSRTTDVQSWDPNLLASPWNQTISALFQRLTIIKAGYLQPSSGEVEGNFTESWEFSPDRLTLTFKVRPNMKFHNIPPVSGRTADMQDVNYSWNRFLATGTSRADFANSINPNSPITGMTTPDANTIVFKLAFPMVTLPALLAFEYGGYFHILPREADGGFDIRRQPIGTGPWTLAQHEPSTRIVFKRNEGYYMKEFPNVDTVEFPIIPEYAAGLAQFRRGALYKFPVKADDILATKQDVPQLAMYQTDVNATTSGSFFGWRPSAKNIFRDVRVRQAYSMSLDRDLFIETDYNVSKFQQAGLPVTTRWNSVIYANYYAGWWLDPQSKDFGENAKYFKRDVQGAKQLLSAASYPNGVEMTATSAPDSYGAAYANDVQIVEAMANEAGFKFNSNVVSYNTEFQPRYRDVRGDFEGIAYKPILGGDTDAIEHLFALFSTKSGNAFTGLDVNGRGDYSGDPYLEEQIAKARTEADVEKRRAVAYDLQRYLGKQQYLVRWPGGASGLELAWPVVRNHLTYRGLNPSFRGPHFYAWLDESEPPLKT